VEDQSAMVVLVEKFSFLKLS